MISKTLAIEDQTIRSAGESVKNIIFDDARNIQRTAYSYGTWDDTWQYLIDNNSAFIKKNLGPASLLPEGVQGALIFRPDRSYVTGVSYDDTYGRPREIPGSVIHEIQRDGLLFASTLNRKGVFGIVSTYDAQFIVGTSAVVPSNNSGDPQGVLVFFKDVGPAQIKKYQSISGYLIDIVSGISSDENLLNGRISRVNKTVIRYETTLSSPTASNPLTLSVEFQRIMYLQQIEGYSTLMGVLIVMGVILAGLLFLTISGSIVSPMMQLDKTIRDIADSGDLSHEADICGATEITSLSSSFNMMIRTIREKEELISLMAQERYKALLERAFDAIIVAEPGSYHIIEANLKAQALVGMEGNTLKGKSLLDLHPLTEIQELKLFTGAYEELLQGFVQEGTIITKTSNLIPVEMSASLVEIGKTRYLLCFYRDISERKNMHLALAESEEMFRKIASGTIVGIYLIQDGRFIYANEHLAGMCGYSRDELMQYSDPIGLIAGDCIISLNFFKGTLQSDKDSNDYSQDICVTVKDGSTRIFRTFATTTEYKGKSAIIGTTIDITREHDLEMHRKEANDKIEQIMEQLAIYNDHIRNPLTVIFGYAELEGGNRMKEIQNQVRIIDDIIDQVDKGFLESAKIREFMRKHHFSDGIND